MIWWSFVKSFLFFFLSFFIFVFFLLLIYSWYYWPRKWNRNKNFSFTLSFITLLWARNENKMTKYLRTIESHQSLNKGEWPFEWQVLLGENEQSIDETLHGQTLSKSTTKIPKIVKKKNKYFDKENSNLLYSFMFLITSNNCILSGHCSYHFFFIRNTLFYHNFRNCYNPNTDCHKSWTLRFIYLRFQFVLVNFFPFLFFYFFPLSFCLFSMMTTNQKMTTIKID